MREGSPNPQINFSKMPIAGNIAGAIVALGSIAICLVGLPALRYAFPVVLVAGGGVALVLHFIRHKTPGETSILSATKK